jgi:cytochrome c oxidase subunit III
VKRAEGGSGVRPALPAVDVSDRPTEAFGPRGPVWWGTIGFMIVESATLATVLVALFFARRNFPSWPPPGTARPDLLLPTISVALLVASAIPIRLFDRAARRLDPRAVTLWLWTATVLTAVVTVLRYFEITRSLNVRYDTNAYGSVTWAVLIGHFTLLLVDVFETGTLAAIFTLGKHEAKHFVDATDNAMYSYFMVVIWLPLFAVVYLLPYLGW